MGSVWVADHLGLGTRVAVKFLSPTFTHNQSVVERFRREAMAASQIKSPHVAQMFDQGVTSDGMPYIIMELLEGEDLGQRVRRIGPLDLNEVALIVTQVAKALARAHQVHIVHRDIKPENIFLINLDGEPLVKVLDFGVAKLQGSELGMTSTGSMVGTPLYMSPEQLLSSKHVDFRSDLWSLGVVTYHLLTGGYPFSGETIGSLSVAVHAGVFTRPSTLRPGLSPAIDAWMQRALCRDPAERFGSAKELADELRRAVNNQTLLVAAGPPVPTVVLPSAEPPAGVPLGGPPTQLLRADAPLPGSDTPAKTFAGEASAGSGSRGRKKAARLVTFVAVAGLGALGIWFLLRPNVPDSTSSPAAHSGATSAAAEVVPASSQVPQAPSGLALPSPPAALSSRGLVSPPSVPAKPQSTAKKPSRPRPENPDFGF
jgi:serine/threonine-protein kinase